MKRIYWMFTLAWATFCLITTGAAALQPGVFNDGLIRPDVAQDQAGGIYNQGARAAYHRQLVPGPTAIFIDAHNSLENISVRYWLYPTDLTGSRFGTDLDLALQYPEAHTIIYVGPAIAYTQAASHMPARFHATIVAATKGDVFAVIQTP